MADLQTALIERVSSVQTKTERQEVHINSSKAYHFVKRAFDIALSLVSLVVLSPVFLIVSAVIFLSDFHSPIFKQQRLTKDSKLFYMYKFRSMCVDAEDRLAELQEFNEADEDGKAFKMTDDPRITRIGKFLRKTSIDELPQLVNILKGNMSFVGPRPPLPREVEEYDDYELHRLDVKSGLTCYWQCSGRSNLSFDEWVSLDIKYINEQSLKTVIKILFKTFGAVFKGDGAV